ncbi:hypothetical protein E2320_007331, partial [Naja naja]
GLIVLDHNVSYYLKPPANTTSEAHALFRAKDLLVKGGTCQQGDLLPNSVADVTGIFHPLKRFRAQKQNLGVTKQRILEIANYVDKPPTLSGSSLSVLQVPEHQSGPDWPGSLDGPRQVHGERGLPRHPRLLSPVEEEAAAWSALRNMTAQLLTGITFRGTTIGMAPLEGMCSVENSGGVSMDHSELPIGAAATMAHEIGHNFGMSHDAEGCCVEATASQGGCVMAAATGHPFPRVFSSCSRSQLESYFQKGGGVCLFNLPDTKDLVVGKKCGNGFLEEGEECDCGEAELKTAGIMCREPAGTCDLPEYCTGASPYCPANVYLLDGSTYYEAILTALVVVFLLVMLCLLLGLYACYRRQNSLLHKWAKGFRKRTKTWSGRANPQPRPPYKPLPKTLLAKDVTSSPSSPLLVMVPPTSSKPAGIGASNHLSKPLKPLPGLKVQPASFAFKK